MGLVIGDDVSKIVIGDQVLYDRDNQWEKYTNFDGKITSGILLSQISSTTMSIYGMISTMPMSPKINAPEGYKFISFGSGSQFSGGCLENYGAVLNSCRLKIISDGQQITVVDSNTDTTIEAQNYYIGIGGPIAIDIEKIKE